MMARAQGGEYHAVLDELFPGFVHPSRREDASLRQLVHDMGDDVGVGGLRPPADGDDQPAGLAADAGVVSNVRRWC